MKLFQNPHALNTKEFVVRRIATLKRKEKRSSDTESENFSAELAILERIAKFPFADYPDYTCPWHLIRWPTERMRWDHVFDVVQIVESLTHVKGSPRIVGTPITLEPFQVLIILCFLGPEDAEGLRAVREGLLTIARKNAKTTLMAALTLALMLLDEQAHGFVGQELYVGAADRAQAGITFDIMTKMALKDRDLGISDLFHITPSKKEMVNKHTLTQFHALSADAYRAHGLNPAVILYDEIGNVPAPAAADFYSVLTSGDGAQDEPLNLLLSTQAANDVHLFSQKVDLCKKINEEGRSDEQIAGFVFEVPDYFEVEGKKIELDPHDESKWYLANPGLGTICSLASLQKASKDAKALPAQEAKFRNLKLNQRSNPYNPLLSKTAWDACGHEVDLESLYGRPCYLGLDLSGVRDLTSLEAVFEPAQIENEDGETVDGPMPVLSFFFMPGHALEDRAREDKVPYDQWARDGLINVESFKTVDHEVIAGQIQFCLDNFDVQGMAVDRWRIEDTKKQLRERGLGSYADNEEFVVPIGQGYKDMSPCVDVVEKSVIEGAIAHGRHPVLTWNAANAVVTKDPAGGRKFDKAKSYGRIDGIVALSMALRLRQLLRGNPEDGPSAFESDECLM